MSRSYYVYVPISPASGMARDCYNNKCVIGGSDCLNVPANTCTSCGSGEHCTDTTRHCPHCCHASGYFKPGDIGGSSSANVMLRTNSLINSVTIRQTNTLCKNSPPSGYEWINYGLEVDLFCLTGTYIGTVFYGHLRNRISPGNYSTPLSTPLGILGASAPPSYDCYTYVHVHMEVKSGSYSPVINPWSYQQTLYTSTYVYKWTGPDTCYTK